jgi:hypothetical protein
MIEIILIRLGERVAGKHPWESQWNKKIQNERQLSQSIFKSIICKTHTRSRYRHGFRTFFRGRCERTSRLRQINEERIFHLYYSYPGILHFTLFWRSWKVWPFRQTWLRQSRILERRTAFNCCIQAVCEHWEAADSHRGMNISFSESENAVSESKPYRQLTSKRHATFTMESSFLGIWKVGFRIRWSQLPNRFRSDGCCWHRIHISSLHKLLKEETFEWRQEKRKTDALENKPCPWSPLT